ncbi:D-alanyl-D-alanine carboxypeptidase family protein [Paenibacillus thiaminolyticus]|uniref:D-alanyl-D-alanine carboxypeptidase family protein n=1 Tax=Paenibacillus thiaminolyticus TaxID=49283 RepID=UPI002543F1EA|nr:serine hydrolase [Paenibacillus thiaminolyticus]WII35273.1 serine hydrolase [Paenibacillus thiaminolyticus]
MKIKKQIALTLALFLALTLAACSDSGNTQNRNTPTPSSSVDTTVPQTTESGTNSLQEDVNSAHTEDIENIPVDITATNAYVINIDSNSALYQKNSDEHIAPASTAKMLTALTVLDYCSLDDTFMVDSEIDLIASDSSKAWLNYGDTLTVKQLLVAMLLPSGNDAAYTLAVNAGKRIAGEDGLGAQQAIEVFANEMNLKAKEVGATSSNFITPDGYDADGQYTTAFDLAQIAKACLGNDILSEIMDSYKISDTWMNGREVTYYNTNNLLNPDSSYYYSNAVGLKTGTSGDGGSCLVSAATINGQTYICVVMGASAETRYSDTLTIFNEIDPTLSLSSQNSDSLTVPGGLRRR